jgi:hypothetical protein
MMLALVWLIISAPYIYKVQEQKNKITRSSENTLPVKGDKENAFNPFGNATEEKTCDNLNTISEEYLHGSHLFEHYIAVPSVYNNIENVKIYIAFHGELLSPPPEA